jgi:LCP family protein required for cell wall assembly
MNILLIGSDFRPGEGERSDTFMVLHIPADRKSVYLVSYPRDMWVAIPGHGQAKINAAYSYGGVALAVSTLENLTAARIDHVMVTDFSNFMKLVDTVGPVTVDNPVASTKIVPDEYGVAYDFTHAGPLYLSNGEMALSFVRERKNLPNGDLDRTLRQRAFVKALVLKVATPEVLANPVKLNELIGDIGQYLKVDDRASVDFSVRTAATAPATVISRPSRTHAVPSAMTIRVWNGAHLRRSIRAGIRLLMAPPGAPGRFCATSDMVASGVRRYPRRGPSIVRGSGSACYRKGSVTRFEPWMSGRMPRTSSAHAVPVSPRRTRVCPLGAGTAA